MLQEHQMAVEEKDRRVAVQEKEFNLGGQFNEDGTTRLEIALLASKGKNETGASSLRLWRRDRLVYPEAYTARSASDQGSENNSGEGRRASEIVYPDIENDMQNQPIHTKEPSRIEPLALSLRVPMRKQRPWIRRPV
ncbi:MAG: hypothetical protein M5R38_17685 [Candidatus Methylomirabilis sp.]|nr:hypothetical protein [Candidatus Methylomirabilis sp.]